MIPERGLGVSGLTIRDGAGRVLVRNLSLLLPPGKVTALVGESGSGKTLTARALIDLVPPGLTVQAEGRFLDGRDLTSFTKKEWSALRGAAVGFLAQDPKGAFNPRRRVGSQLTEAARLLDRRSAREVSLEAAALLEELGLADPEGVMSLYPDELSGGMAQRAALARLLIRHPAYLLCDEPTTALDESTAFELTGLLRRICDQRGTGVLFITHQLSACRNFADRVAVMWDGELVEEGAAAQILTLPRHRYTAALLAARPRMGLRGEAYFPVESWVTWQNRERSL